MHDDLDGLAAVGVCGALLVLPTLAGSVFLQVFLDDVLGGRQARLLPPLGVDLIDCSSGGAVPDAGPPDLRVAKSVWADVHFRRAVEWARFNINVNAIAPGAFSSEMMDGMIARMGDITRNFPRPRLGDPAQDGYVAASDPRRDGLVAGW